ASEAKAGLTKKTPKGMEWVPLEQLPKLHWADTGKQVDPSVVQWWVVQSIQQKSPVCGPILRRYLKMCKPAEAAALAKFILASWLGRETATLSAEDAATKAKAEADRMWAQYGNNKWYVEQYGNKENLYKQLYQNISNDTLYSAIGEKGMLALVAAAGDGDC